MTIPPLLLVASLFTAGIVGGVTVHLATPTPIVSASSAGVGISPAGPTNLAERLTSLSRTTDSIENRLAMLEMAPRSADRTAIAESGEAAALPVDQAILTAIEEYMSRATTDQGAVRDLVASTLTDIRSQEDMLRDQEREDARLLKLQERVDRMAVDLALYNDQAVKLYDALNVEQIKRDELREAARNGTADRSTERDEMRNLGAETLINLGQFLTAEQLAAYQESNTGGQRRGGGRGGN